MNFFEYIKNDAFFKPLTLKHKRIYYDCIQLLIEKSKELPVLYENDARDCVTIYLKSLDASALSAREISTYRDEKKSKQKTDHFDSKDNPSKFAKENLGEMHVMQNTKHISPNSTEVEWNIMEEDAGTTLQAFEIFNLFRECGWLMPREIGRNGEYVVNISTDCRRVMDFLRKMTEKSSEGTMSNRIFSMYEIMKSAFEKDSVRAERPYTNILVPLIENETELKNELTDLKNSIASIMKAVIVFQDINSFGQFIMKDEMLDKFFSEYFFVKNNGLIPTQISFIKSKLRKIRLSDMYEKMAEECAEKLQISMADATERIERYFAELQYFLSVEYEEHMELIDHRINNYYNLANTRILLMTSNGVHLESMLNDFLNVMAKCSEEEQNAAMEKAADCTCIINQKYVGYKSFEKKKHRTDKGENIGLVFHELSEDEKQAQTEQLFQQAQNPFSVDRVTSFLDAKLSVETKLCMNEITVKSKEELLMYAAAMLYANNEEFAYEVQLSDEVVKTDIADISNITIIKK